MQPWNQRVARGLLLLFVTSVVAILLANVAGIVMPLIVRATLEQTSDVASEMRSAMRWVALVPVAACPLYVLGVWWATSPVPHRGATGHWRIGLRLLVVVYLGLALTTFATRFLDPPGAHHALGVAKAIGWTSLVLAGLMWLREVAGVLSSPGVSRSAWWAAGAYLVTRCGHWVTSVAFDEPVLAVNLIEIGLSSAIGIWIWVLIWRTRRAAARPVHPRAAAAQPGTG